MRKIDTTSFVRATRSTPWEINRQIVLNLVREHQPISRADLARPVPELVIIGRRQLRSNNSWMHNLPALAGGTNRCTLQIHPDDAALWKKLEPLLAGLRD